MKLGKLRKTIKQLGQEYLNLREQTDVCRRAFERTSTNEIETKERILSEYIHCFVLEHLKEIDILDKLSPKTAKILRQTLLNWEKTTRKELSKDYSSDEGIKILPEDQRNKLVLEMRNNSMKFITDSGMTLQSAVITNCFNAALETMERSGSKPPMTMDEYISTLLATNFPTYSKYYEGAWQAFESNNPDKFRHVSASLRELIKSILGDDKEKRIKSLRQISPSESENDLIESLVEIIYTNDRLLNKGVHSDLEENVATLSMRACEIILQFVLERHKPTEVKLHD